MFEKDEVLRELHARLAAAGINPLDPKVQAICMIVNASLVRWVHASVRDPYVITPIVVMLAGVATLAALVPAWRAASTDPMTVLRGD